VCTVQILIIEHIPFFVELRSASNTTRTPTHRAILFDTFKADFRKPMQMKSTANNVITGVSNEDECMVKAMEIMQQGDQLQWKVTKDRKHKGKPPITTCRILSLAQ
jgi:hypothetical protein